MEWLLALGALVGGGSVAALGVRRLADRRADRRESAEDLDAMRGLADEDVTVFGEQLSRLGQRVDGQALDVEARTDYQSALDAYEAAQRQVPRMRSADEISGIVDTLATGRYAMACVEARLAGREIPERRVPCFFNPQHGPSARDVVWTPPGRGTRTVPACTQDAARVEAREKPEVRMVTVGSRKVAYWEAGAAFMPYGRGYFPGATATAAAASMMWAFDPSPGGSAYDHGHGGGFGDFPSQGMIGLDGGGSEGGDF